MDLCLVDLFVIVTLVKDSLFAHIVKAIYN